MNLREIETLRTKEELINYFKGKGQNITEEEIEILKKSYEKAENKNGALIMKQLDDVAGGINVEFHSCKSLLDYQKTTEKLNKRRTKGKILTWAGEHPTLEHSEFRLLVVIFDNSGKISMDGRNLTFDQFASEHRDLLPLLDRAKANANRFIFNGGPKSKEYCERFKNDRHGIFEKLTELYKSDPELQSQVKNLIDANERFRKSQGFGKTAEICVREDTISGASRLGSSTVSTAKYPSLRRGREDESLLANKLDRSTVSKSDHHAAAAAQSSAEITALHRPPSLITDNAVLPPTKLARVQPPYRSPLTSASSSKTVEALNTFAPVSENQLAAEPPKVGPNIFYLPMMLSAESMQPGATLVFHMPPEVASKIYEIAAQLGRENPGCSVTIRESAPPSSSALDSRQHGRFSSSSSRDDLAPYFSESLDNRLHEGSSVLAASDGRSGYDDFTFGSAPRDDRRDEQSPYFPDSHDSHQRKKSSSSKNHSHHHKNSNYDSSDDE